MYNTEYFVSEARKLGIELNDHQVGQFISYYELLLEWNSFMNLTAITDYDEVIRKHFLDSISILHAIQVSRKCRFIDSDLIISGEKGFDDSSFFDNNESISLIDVGSGAGFPGIPLKIAFPNMKITLLDSLAKRVKFLNEVISQLGLTNIEAVHGRAEDYASPSKLREKYDFCVSRAVANLSSLSEYCIPFVKVGGFFIPYKSERGKEEIMNARNAISLLGGDLVACSEFSLADTDLFRSFYFIRKAKNTSKKYPRKSGTPTKEPL